MPRRGCPSLHASFGAAMDCQASRYFTQSVNGTGCLSGQVIIPV